MFDIIKYPRTQHIIGSKGEPTGVSLSVLSNHNTVIEEKMEGRNVAFRFDGAGVPYGINRGNAFDLYDRSNNKVFNLFKDWVIYNQDTFLERFEDRYVVYGEWLAISNSIFYDNLPHYFMEFDIYDLANGVFLDTPSRHKLLDGISIISVPVLSTPTIINVSALQNMIKPSLYKTDNWISAMKIACERANDNFNERLAKIDTTMLSEGLYIKVEENGQVIDRYKFIRAEFVQCIINQQEHHDDRIHIMNKLADGINLF